MSVDAHAWMRRETPPGRQAQDTAQHGPTHQHKWSSSPTRCALSSTAAKSREAAAAARCQPAAVGVVNTAAAQDSSARPAEHATDRCERTPPSSPHLHSDQAHRADAQLKVRCVQQVALQAQAVAAVPEPHREAKAAASSQRAQQLHQVVQRAQRRRARARAAALGALGRRSLCGSTQHSSARCTQERGRAWPSPRATNTPWAQRQTATCGARAVLRWA